ncbi:biotin--[acetyl-CoA-carboxylase] ligase [Caulobacter henricii]|uniref:biotin--[biotin carboxyl-carrier protein] ligase n=1 Tax=Caulobacter henricii TaxID=69395 RepID=A0A0P0P4I2_9CAUL|nr:biotin--[acetyl-CoA-carboxylase] ligase [Caulobacter henricii]ALL15264.1 biotin--protein ligase [Caulobacter henricii]
MTGEPPAPAAPPVVVFDEIDSTNAEARRRAEAGELGPVWLLGLRQSAGRGRRGRAWETGAGNLAATLLFSTDKPPAVAAQVSFVAALAVADLLASFVPSQRVSLKWPNDPMLDGLKVSGILVESGTRPSGGLWIAVGFGVNLAAKPLESERPATALSVHLAGAPPLPTEAVQILAEAFDRWSLVWDSLGFPAIADAWTARAHGLGAPCVARLGTETVEGIAEGLDDDGALRLRLPDGRLRRITAGDVFFGEAI